uniref:Claudin 2 n=1 Tax=Salvator merianae TaxID=96440 RepID=A0A8D0B7T3_SALMN
QPQSCTREVGEAGSATGKSGGCKEGKMISVGLQLLGYLLALLGLFCTTITTLLPNWRTASYIGSSIITAVGFSKGLWMECATYSTGITQCDVYSSLLNLPADLQAAQAMMSTSIAISLLASMISVMGLRCTVFSQGSPGKDKVAVVGGAVFILGGLLCFIPVVWNIHGVLRDFYNPIIPDSMKFEIGEALYLGVLSSLFSLMGGAILCASCPPTDPQARQYSPYHSRTMHPRLACRWTAAPTAEHLAQAAKKKVPRE